MLYSVNNTLKASLWYLLHQVYLNISTAGQVAVTKSATEAPVYITSSKSKILKNENKDDVRSRVAT